MFKYKIKGDRKMKEETREKIKDKEDKTPLPPHNFFYFRIDTKKADNRRFRIRTLFMGCSVSRNAPTI